MDSGFPFLLRTVFRSFIYCACAAVFFALAGCNPPEKPQVPIESGFEEVTWDDFPSFTDDGERESLQRAIEQSLHFYSRIPPDRTFSLGELSITANTLKETLELFSQLLNEGALDNETLAEHFHVYRSRATSESGESLVTGYFEPVLEARLQPDSSFHYPLYGLPPELLTIDLNSFDAERFEGTRLVGRVEENRVVPFYTRQEIDQKEKIASQECQIAWIEDPIDGFFLHVQGSGKLHLGHGEYARVGYAGTNGHPYRSIGRYLIDQGILEREIVSLQTIRDHLQTHPEQRDEVLFYNPRYIFFRWVDEGPVGAINVVLTPGRSVATDPQMHPQGAVGFLETQQPLVNEAGNLLGWKPLRRWVVNQDTGGAIKGVGRTDLFFGSGKAAEGLAGNMKSPGRIYFLVKR